MFKTKFIALSLFFASSIAVIAQNKSITFDNLYTNHTFNPERVWGLRSMNDGSFYTSISYAKGYQEIIKYSYNTSDSVATIFSMNGVTEFKNFAGYAFSSDDSKILFTTDVEKIYRHSTRETVWVYDLKTKEMTNISENGKQSYTTFSPDASKVAFVSENNLFVYDLASKIQTKVTSDGMFNKIINGSTDWVYEEEFGFDKGFAWSPDNKHIAYYKFDESNVKEFNMIMYQHQLYPSDYRFKYPKAGEENSKVSIYVYNLKKDKSTKVELPEVEYIPRIKWASARNLALQTLNRHQNELNVYFHDVKSNKSFAIYTETSETYTEVIEDWFFLTDLKAMLFTSEKDGYKHIYSLNYENKLVTPVTSGYNQFLWCSRCYTNCLLSICSKLPYRARYLPNKYARWCYHENV